jgi:very-long-chain (3R)-3-hydroxyacyl-CoA dehydratase
MSSTPQTRSQRPTPRASTLTSTYLLGYNSVSFALWFTLLGRLLFLVPALAAHSKLHGLHDALYPLLLPTQTLAVLEVFHALLGLVRASPLTTGMQVASRLLLVWGVLYRYPNLVSTTDIWGRPAAGEAYASVALAGMLTAWCTTEVIRYGYFVYTLGVSPRLPGWLLWLRYNTFFVLYPLGISSECALIWMAMRGPAAKAKEGGMQMFYKLVLAVYVPGSYILYTHMMAQRRKVLKGKGRRE